MAHTLTDLVVPGREDGGQGASTRGTSTGWVVSLFTLLVVAQAPAAMLASGLFDNIYTVIDSSWRTVTVVEGNAARNVQIAGMLALAVVSAHLLLEAARRRPVRLNILAIAATVGACCQLLRGPDAAEAIGTATYVLAIWAAAVSVPTHQALRWLGIFSLFFWATNWLYVGLQPDLALKECREDKCSFLGSMLVGYTQHEQTLGLYTALLLPMLAFVRRPFRWPAVAFGLLTLAATGSRTALASALLGLLALWLLAPLRDRPESDWSVRRLPALRLPTAFIPVAALLGALLLFLLLPPKALTGRGQVWRVVRDDVLGHPWFGPGRDSIVHGYDIGLLDFVAWTEHNQAGYLLAVGGVIGLTVFVAGLFQLGLLGLRPEGAPAILVLLAPALGLATEVVWSFNLLSGSTTWTLLLTVLLMPKTSATAPVDGEQTLWRAMGRRVRRLGLSTLALISIGAALALALTAAAPKKYESDVVLFATVTSSTGEHRFSAVELTQYRARTYAAVIKSSFVTDRVADAGSVGAPWSDQIDVEVPNDTGVLRIIATASTPDAASALSASVARRAVETLPELEPGLHLTPLIDGAPAARPVSRGFVSSALGGAAIGLLVALPIWARSIPDVGFPVAPTRRKVPYGAE